MPFPDYADSKKCQTFINILADSAKQIQAAASTCVDCREAWNAINPDPTGTPLEGNLNAVNSWINQLITLGQHPVTTGMIAAERSNHVNEY